MRANEQDLRAYGEIDEVIQDLVWLVWDRWHPKNPATEGQAPEVVYAGLTDLRRIAHELEALWVRLGNTDLGLDRLVPERDLRERVVPGLEPDPVAIAALRELMSTLDAGVLPRDADDRGPVEDPEADDPPERDDGVIEDDARELERDLDPPGLGLDEDPFDPHADGDDARREDDPFPDTFDPEL